MNITMYIEPDKRTLTVEMALQAGFSHAGYADISKMKFMSEIRDMCAVNRCGQYNKRWSCPPACGTLEEVKAQVMSYDYGMILQATRDMEDDYDWDAIQEASRACRESLERLVKQMRGQGKELLAMGMDGCSKCEKCTYPDEPCRFPDQLGPSMEACGLFVSRECEKAGLNYKYGNQTMTINAMLFIRE